MVLFNINNSQSIIMKPNCHYNKMAPHHESTRESKTFGAIYHYLEDRIGSGNLQHFENKCGDTTLDSDEQSSSSRGKGRQGNKKFFFNFLNLHRPPIWQTTMAPTKYPSKPPYWSGGMFADKPFNPAVEPPPSDSIKPVYENLELRPTSYLPGGKPHKVERPLQVSLESNSHFYSSPYLFPISLLLKGLR